MIPVASHVLSLLYLHDAAILLLWPADGHHNLLLKTCIKLHQNISSSKEFFIKKIRQIIKSKNIISL